MHAKKMRFLTRAALKQHLYLVHREDDASILIQHKIDKTLIKKRSWDMKGSLNEYKKTRKIMQCLYEQGALPLQEIR
jgi:predicted transcriptional regulator YheO